MDFGHLLEGLIFLIIGGVVFFALFPSLLSSGLTATSNATYTKTFPSTIAIGISRTFIIAHSKGVK